MSTRLYLLYGVMALALGYVIGASGITPTAVWSSITAPAQQVTSTNDTSWGDSCAPHCDEKVFDVYNAEGNLVQTVTATYCEQQGVFQKHLVCQLFVLGGPLGGGWTTVVDGGAGWTAIQRR